MRADRLVATLLFLQARGQVTAGEVADHLEISERTARRDLDALAVAGLPVYSSRGRGGGWALLGGARTDLTGLTRSEARALFLVAGPSGRSPEVRAALRKLVRALPETFRAEAEAAAGSVVVEPDGWGRPARDPQVPAHLDALQLLVIEGRQARLGYVGREGKVSDRIVHPLGLVSKGRRWYLIAGTSAGQRTFRVDRVRFVEARDEPVDRPPDFDLASAWRAIAEVVDEFRGSIEVEAITERRALGPLRSLFGEQLTAGAERPDGRVEVSFAGVNPWFLAHDLAGFGSMLEVVRPTELRHALAELGRQLVAAYDESAG